MRFQGDSSVSVRVCARVLGTSSFFKENLRGMEGGKRGMEGPITNVMLVEGT